MVVTDTFAGDACPVAFTPTVVIFDAPFDAVALALTARVEVPEVPGNRFNETGVRVEAKKSAGFESLTILMLNVADAHADASLFVTVIVYSAEPPADTDFEAG